MSEIKNLVDSIDKDTIKKIMADNGATLYKDKEDELWYDTICHGGHSHKLCYYLSNKNFYCYTSCGSMSIITFLMKVRACSVGEVINYLKSFVGNQTSRMGFGKHRIVDVEFINETDRLLELQNRNEINNRIRLGRENNNYELIDNKDASKFYDSTILNYFEDKYYTGWIKDGISIPSMQKFGIKWYESEKHIIIPHLNSDGKLVGIRRRSLKPEDSKNKYMPEIIENKVYGHSLGLNLYGLYENKNAIIKRKTALIVEGEKSVMLSDTYQGDRSVAVATCGFNITDWQLNKIASYGVEKVYLAFDKDYDLMHFEDKYKTTSSKYKECLSFIERINSLAKKLSRDCEVRIIIDRDNLLELKDSPLDKGKEVYEELRNNSLLNEIKLKNLR